MGGFRKVEAKQRFPELEERVLERWRETDVFGRSLANRADAEVWTFYEGPPTANGRPGSHHVFSRVFKDVYPRYRTMRGYRVPRKAGWDTHGLPVELEVERELGISSKQEIEAFGIAEFNARCRQSVFAYVEDWNRLTERIGFWVDLDDPYVTLDPDYIESVWWSLRQIWDAGRLYEGHKVVPYCPRCGTALSSHEVALGYRDVEDPSVYVRLPVEAAGPLREGDALLVWTTTPWTLISNAAVAVNPEMTYVRARVGEELLVVAESLRERVLGEGAEVLDSFPGTELAGVAYSPPFDYVAGFGPRGHTVLEADFVSAEEGTGLVHTAIAFGEDDFRLGEQYGLTLQNPVTLEGTFDERVGELAGRFVKDADPEIVAMLERSGRLFRGTTYEHAYPHCWRCGTPLLYYAKSSWYVRTSEVREELLANNREIGWHPEHIREGRFGKWLENNVDWALSRDRYWGTPLPIWECGSDDCEERFCAGSVAELRERAIGEVPEDLHRPYIDEVRLRCESCGGEMERVGSVIDTWYDSGAMPFAQFHYPFENRETFEERFPADFICEAIDQTRGWFYTLLAESTLLFERSSYRNCVCLGLILDSDGQKMSKSRGNVVEPWDVISAHGADAFRWYYLTAQQPWSGYRFSVETVGESARQFLLTLWNTYSFWVLYANAEGLEPEDFDGKPGTSEDLDRWILSRLQSTIATVIERMDDFDCTAAGEAIAAFVEDLSNWYVRLSRRRFWEGDRAAFATLRHCLLETVALLAPFIPFLADEIHVNLGGGEGGDFAQLPDSVHLRDFPAPDPDLSDPELEAAISAVLRTVALGRAARAGAKVKVRQPLRRAVIVAGGAEREAISARAELIEAELNVKQLEFVAEEGELVSYAVKPNYRTLGPRFGKLMPQVAAAVAALDAAHVARAIESGGEFGVNIDGRDHTLSADDVILALEPLEGYEVESETGHAVGLQLELDDELRREGLAREIVHAVQNARRDAGLEVTDRIELGLAGDGELLEAAREHQSYLAGEVLATAVRYDGAGAGSDPASATIEGRELQITLARA
jgi:isoleucyl-tRNA synthetase